MSGLSGCDPCRGDGGAEARAIAKIDIQSRKRFEIAGVFQRARIGHDKAHRLRERGDLRFGIGTDISGGHSPSIFDTCRMAVTSSRMLEDGVDPSISQGDRGTQLRRIDFREAFWLATVGGADVLDIPTGLFAKENYFDAIVIDTSVDQSNIDLKNNLDTLDDVFQKIIHNAGRTNIIQTWVSGRLIQ